MTNKTTLRATILAQQEIDWPKHLAGPKPGILSLRCAYIAMAGTRLRETRFALMNHPRESENG